MYANSKLSYAIAAILGSGALGAAHAALAATTSDSSDQLQAIIVTAQRRVQNIQDVPITMQVFTAKTLAQLNISNFDDYIKYLPNVSAASNGPGQSDIFMRGLNSGNDTTQFSGTSGFFPNVAVYLDNQSVQLPNRNLDVYAADLNRIEVLEGPQGTLFGGGAEAGVIRYITNKPVLDKTEGNVNAGYGVTAHGDPNTNLTAVLNIPLISDKLAVRAVIYSDSRGGYIDNVPATFTRKNTDPGIHYANYPAINGQCPDGQPNAGYCVPPGSPAINNYNIAQRAINPVTYKGTRAELLYKFNDDWNILITQMYQNMDSEGVFYSQPNASDGAALRPLEVTLFNNAFDKDKFENTALTVHGKIDFLKVVYTGGYLVRHVEQTGDYTNYARGVYVDYYQCYGPGTGFYINGGTGDPNLKSTCFSPRQSWREIERNEHQQHEIRVSTPEDWRIRGIAGAYYEENDVFDQTDYFSATLPVCTTNGAPGTPGNSGCLSDVGTAPGASVESPGVQNGVSYIADTRRRVKQIAWFVSTDIDLIPKVLTLTLGTRHFKYDESLKGDVTSSFSCFEAGASATGCVLNNANNLDARNLSNTEAGYRSRGDLTWHITPDVMVYYTYSQGFRPGGFNLTNSLHIPGTDGINQFHLPLSYQSDSLTNQEIGWKTEWFKDHLQWNGAVYRENWNNVQVAFFDPGETGNLTFGTNGQNFRVKGVETSIVAQVLGGLTLQGTASWNQSEQTNSPALIDNNPASNNFGKPITEKCDSAGLNCTPLNDLFGPIGGPTANSPPMQFSLRARYDWRFVDYKWFVQAGAAHTDHSFTESGANPSIATGGAITSANLRFENPAYTTYDASFGVAKGTWDAQVYSQNLTNSHASTFTNTDQFIVAQTPLRPRVIGVSFGYKF